LIMCRGGEMADTGDLKSPGRKAVRVRVPPSASIQILLHNQLQGAQLVTDIDWRQLRGCSMTAGDLPFSAKGELPFIDRWRLD
jgi:hypothetical protein